MGLGGGLAFSQSVDICGLFFCAVKCFTIHGATTVSGGRVFKNRGTPNRSQWYPPTAHKGSGENDPESPCKLHQNLQSNPEPTLEPPHRTSQHQMDSPPRPEAPQLMPLENSYSSLILVIERQEEPWPKAAKGSHLGVDHVPKRCRIWVN